ncbi:hypothetical protein BKA81DRAFT_371499 [Phyllosticta paracitricarpa]
MVVLMSIVSVTVCSWPSLVVVRRRVDWIVEVVMGIEGSTDPASVMAGAADGLVTVQAVEKAEDNTEPSAVAEQDSWALSIQEHDSSQVELKRSRSRSTQTLRGTRSTQALTLASRITLFLQRHSGVSLTQTSARALMKHLSRHPPGFGGATQDLPQVVMLEVASEVAVVVGVPPKLMPAVAATPLAKPTPAVAAALRPRRSALTPRSRRLAEAPEASTAAAKALR